MVSPVPLYPLKVMPLPPAGEGQEQALGDALMKQPLSVLPRQQAIALIKKLYSPDERFAQGFFRLKISKLNQNEAEAWDNTLKELDFYVEKLINNLDDPYMQTLGMVQGDHYEPVGIYGFRPLETHAYGIKLLEVIEAPELQEILGVTAQSKYALAHGYSMLSSFRSLSALKGVFALMAFEAMAGGYSHIFFFMSDYRLKDIYARFGLQFPEALTFPDSKHLVGFYHLTPENRQRILAYANQHGLAPPTVTI